MKRRGTVSYKDILPREEIFDEIVSPLHCYSAKLYSKKTEVKKILEVSLNAKS